LIILRFKFDKNFMWQQLKIFFGEHSSILGWNLIYIRTYLILMLFKCMVPTSFLVIAKKI